ncbi:hypothetical protein PTTG_30887, partial [Puccinia triticina 1-1 BBBD Race 1]
LKNHSPLQPHSSHISQLLQPQVGPSIKTIKGPSLHHLILSLSSLSDLNLYPVALTSKSSASTARPPLLNHHNHQHS